MNAETELQDAFQEELEKLERTSNWIDTKLKQLSVIPRYYGHDYTEQALDAIREQAQFGSLVTCPRVCSIYGNRYEDPRLVRA